MKLFVDDLRDPPDDSWVVVRTAEKAIEALSRGEVEVLSLDHDLGEISPGVPAKTGYDVVKWIEEQVHLHGFLPPEIRVHSANPVGAENITRAANAIHREVSKRNKEVMDHWTNFDALKKDRGILKYYLFGEDGKVVTDPEKQRKALLHSEKHPPEETVTFDLKIPTEGRDDLQVKVILPRDLIDGK